MKKKFFGCSCTDRQADGVVRLRHLVFPGEVNAAFTTVMPVVLHYVTVPPTAPYFAYVAAKDIASLVAVVEAVDGGLLRDHKAVRITRAVRRTGVVTSCAARISRVSTNLSRK